MTTTTNQWTPQRVKDELPDVTVIVRGKGETETVVSATVRGRKNEFASVNLATGESAQYAWETIANTLNRGRSLYW